ncbi:valine--tRNA ligase [bacterium]|nr:valine--tRNA ligase [bacterium]
MSEQNLNSYAEQLYKFQEENDYFKANPESHKPRFTIMIPPPNVTGNLHVGHAFTMTMQDIAIRYKRMKGFDTLLLPGTDHASIATQMLVEKHLKTKGIDKNEIGREKFLEYAWDWKNTYAGNITSQLRTIGYSADWSRERFTLDAGLNKAVVEAFVRMYEDGLIYKDKRLVNWDPALLTSLSDLEVLMVEENGSMWHIRYDIEGSDETIIIATTRPETMLGDTGIAVNPNDERFKHLIGKFAILPILGRRIEIVGDDYADMTKGTGAVKITPAHDFNDFEVGKRHNLNIINIFHNNATIDTSKIPEENDFVKSLEGLDRFEARKLIVEKLKDLGNLIKIEPYVHQVPHSERGGAVVEPRMTEQWYLNVSGMAKKAIDLVKTGKLEFIPKMWENTFFAWLENIQPWCISRQLWWGHQIPAYYTDDGKIIVARNLEEAQAKAGAGVHLTQDEDVLDTWFSSGLWPMSTLGWPDENNIDFKTYFPTSTLITGFDIIFFWVARMVMFSVYFTGKSPFEKVVIHGLVRDEHGVKMSKTKGNVVNPLDLIDEFDVDSVRWTVCSLSGQGRDINFGKSSVENGRKFITKLKNAINFWEQKGVKEASDFKGKDSSAITNWILDKMNSAIQNATKSIENYRYDEYAQTIYHFVWDDFCDNFIELSKSELNGEKKDLILSVAKLVIQNILKMLQPVIPFTTALLWQNLGFGRDVDFVNEKYPEIVSIDGSNVSDIDWLLSVITTIRNIRAENKIGFKESLNISFKNIDADKNQYIPLIEAHTNVVYAGVSDDMIDCVIDKSTTLSISLPQTNKEEELQKARAELEQVKKRIASLEAQLSNESFVSKAPTQVIEDRKKSLSELKEKMKKLETVIK